MAALGVLLSTPSGAEIRVGFAAPLSGRHAPVGLGMERALEAAVAEANAAGGVLGETIVLETEDDGCAKETAEGAARVLVARTVSLVIGHPCSAAAVAAVPVYGPADVLFIAVGARHPDVTRAMPAAPVLRLAGRDDRQGEAAARRLLAEAPSRRVAIIHDRTGYARAIVEDAVATLKASADVSPVSLLPIVANRNDYGETVARLQADRAEAVFFAGYPDEAGVILMQMASLAIDIPFVGSDSLATPDFAAIAGRSRTRVEVLIAVEPKPPGTERVSDADAAGLRARGAFEAWLKTAARLGTTGGAALAHALRGSRVTTPSLGDIGFDQNGDLDTPDFAPATARGGLWVSEQASASRASD